MGELYLDNIERAIVQQHEHSWDTSTPDEAFNAIEVPGTRPRNTRLDSVQYPEVVKKCGVWGPASKDFVNRASVSDPARGKYIDNTDIGKLIINPWD